MPDYIAFGIILDDIVFPDGRTRMGMLGGGGPQAAFGMRLWADSVGLFARVGADLPESVLDWLDAAGVDRTGVIPTSLPTPRAWQVMEADGKRTQVWRNKPAVIGSQLARSIDDLPEPYRRGHAFHYGIHPAQPDLEFARGLKALGGAVSLETFIAASPGLSEEALAELFTAADVFSPNLQEAASLVGAGHPPDMLRRMSRMGVKVITLRMGAAGSLVSEDGGRTIHAIPAFPVRVVDPVGAGNAYCGAFLAAWMQSGDVLRAGRKAAVAASFLLEQAGLPGFSASLQEEASRRLKQLPYALKPGSLIRKRTQGA